jgi:hypothetical protein
VSAVGEKFQECAADFVATQHRRRDW